MGVGTLHRELDAAGGAWGQERTPEDGNSVGPCGSEDELCMNRYPLDSVDGSSMIQCLSSDGDEFDDESYLVDSGASSSEYDRDSFLSDGGFDADYLLDLRVQATGQLGLD